MIEKTIFDYLTATLSPVPVYMEQPKSKPGTYVVIEKTGSGRENHISTATLALQSYAPTMFGAAYLNESVKNAMDNAITLPDVAASNLNSDYNYTDTTTKQYRYQAVYDLTHY